LAPEISARRIKIFADWRGRLANKIKRRDEGQWNQMTIKTFFTASKKAEAPLAMANLSLLPD